MIVERHYRLDEFEQDHLVDQFFSLLWFESHNSFNRSAREKHTVKPLE